MSNDSHHLGYLGPCELPQGYDLKIVIAIPSTAKRYQNFPKHGSSKILSPYTVVSPITKPFLHPRPWHSQELPGSNRSLHPLASIKHASNGPRLQKLTWLEISPSPDGFTYLAGHKIRYGKPQSNGFPFGRSANAGSVTSMLVCQRLRVCIYIYTCMYVYIYIYGSCRAFFDAQEIPTNHKWLINIIF